MKTIFGEPSKSSSKSASGFSALSPQLQAAFTPLAEAIPQFTDPNRPGVAEAFTPAPLSGMETGAVERIGEGFAPTQESIASDLALQANPFNQSVIDELNRQGRGEFSVLQQALEGAGQAGSNREFLGAGDIDIRRENLIGQFLQNQFNTNIDRALTTLPQARSGEAREQLGVGDFLRQLDLQTKQAPVSALQTGTSLLSPFLQGGTSTGTSTGARKGLLDFAAQAAGGG